MSFSQSLAAAACANDAARTSSTTGSNASADGAYCATAVSAWVTMSAGSESAPSSSASTTLKSARSTAAEREWRKLFGACVKSSQ